MIEQAYKTAESVGLPVWTEDEAGPYQAIPQPGYSWQMAGHPETQPHEYVRGGTAKFLTLFHPASGQVRGKPVTQTTNAVLHPWLKDELSSVLETIPESEEGTIERSWDYWGYPSERLEELTGNPAEKVRMLLVLDNLKGHYSKDFVSWSLERGIALLYTPLGGSWLNMAESVQRIIIRRVLDGQHYKSAIELMDALGAGVRGWNANPTPFVWGGKRKERRRRARERRHALGGSGAYAGKALVPRGRVSSLEAA